MNTSEIAVDKFKEGYNCAQAVLFSLCKYTSIADDFALKIATGFGAGMGRTQHVCGAISGAIIAINLLYGRGAADDSELQDDAYLKIQQLISDFKKENNTVSCMELIDGCNLLTPEGQERFECENMKEKCHQYIAMAARICEKIILQSEAR